RLGGVDHLSVYPDLVVGVRGRRQATDQRRQLLAQLGSQLVPERCWAAHDIPDLVAAAAQAGHQGLVDALHAGLQVALEDAVELEVLPGGDADRAVAPAVCYLVVSDVAVGAATATGDAGPDHQLVVAVQAAPARLLALVAVVLLIDPMKLQDLDVGLVKRRRVLGQLAGDRAAQSAAGLFDHLDLRGLGLT